jgi:polyprenyl-phospho-N-acetylgalactosaminyl synthase
MLLSRMDTFVTSEPNNETTTEPLPLKLRERVFVVIAAYNEESCIEQVAQEVRSLYPNVVVVDDGSSDSTFEAAKRGATFVLRHVINRGQGASLQTGIEFALAHGADYIVTFDADGQHRIDDIQPMVEPIIHNECEITLGSRFLGQSIDMPRSRRITLKAGVVFTRWVNRVQLTDAHNGFRAFSRKAARQIDITLDRMAHASELIDIIKNSGLPFREIPVEIRYTDYSLAKGQSARGAFRIVMHYLLGRVLQ